MAAVESVTAPGLLDGAMALVTGGSRGIGRSTALALARAGSDVCISYLNSPRNAREVADEISAMGRRALVVRADMSEAEDVEALVDVLASEAGRLDILVSSAAGGGFNALTEATRSQFEYAMRINVQALMLLAQRAKPLFAGTVLRRARVVTVSSHGGTRAMANYGLIGAAKGAIESMTRHLAFELGPLGVNVNCVCAGAVDTGALASHPRRQEILDAQRKRSLAGDEPITPEDVANAIVFLCSSSADKIQGQTLMVDGGSSILA
jgi:enoyl-[acyl-carrier protein] reductase III